MHVKLRQLLQVVLNQFLFKMHHPATSLRYCSLTRKSTIRKTILFPPNTVFENDQFKCLLKHSDLLLDPVFFLLSNTKEANTLLLVQTGKIRHRSLKAANPCYVKFPFTSSLKSNKAGCIPDLDCKVMCCKSYYML